MIEEPEYFGPKSFSDAAVQHFPELSELKEDADLLDVQMGVLAASGRAAIERGDMAFLRRLFAFLEDALNRPKLHHEIPRAVRTTFLTPGDFERSQSGSEAWALLPEKLKHALQKAV